MGSRRSSGRDVCGILLLDKPQGVTSNRALQRTKRLYDANKAGHTGSLDPLATGMLPICFGAATRVSGYLLNAGKTYVVTVQFGVATDTGDADGAVIACSDASPATREEALRVLESFLGTIQQVPPMYSALKHQGRRLYELARQGTEVDRPPRTIRIFSINLEDFQWPHCTFTVTCSKGTYIRSLVVDVAEALGTLGHVTALRRLAVEPFGRHPMLDFDQLEAMARPDFEALDAALLRADSAVTDWPEVVLPPTAVSALRQGRELVGETDWPLGVVRLYAEEREFLGMGESLPGGILKSRRLFPSF